MSVYMNQARLTASRRSNSKASGRSIPPALSCSSRLGWTYVGRTVVLRTGFKLALRAPLASRLTTRGLANLSWHPHPRNSRARSPTTTLASNWSPEMEQEKVFAGGLDTYQNKVLSVRATEMLYNGLSHTSSLCSHSSRGSYCVSQPWRRSRRRTSSGLASPPPCSDVPAGNRASRPTDDEVTEGRLLASSPLAMFFPPDFVVLFWISRGIWRGKRQALGTRIVALSGLDFQSKMELPL